MTYTEHMLRRLERKLMELRNEVMTEHNLAQDEIPMLGKGHGAYIEALDNIAFGLLELRTACNEYVIKMKGQ